jgi:hypothetical protein
MIKNIAIVSGPKPNCGIFYWGGNVFEILKKSKKYNFYHLKLSSYSEFKEQTEFVDGIIYNWHKTTMPWCTTDVFLETSIPQFLIHGHTANVEMIDFTGIDAFISVNPSIKFDDPKFYAGFRPIVYYDDIQYFPPSEILKIGTTGIGDDSKNVKYILQLINLQFTEPVIFNVHQSVGDYTRDNKNILQQKLNALKSLAKSNVIINYTTDRFTDYENVRWANNNDVNVYVYPNYDSQGVSGSIDKALAARKPIAVNNSNFFDHIRCDQNNLEITPLKEIIQHGLTPISKYYDMWNPNTFLEQYENILENYMKKDN